MVSAQETLRKKTLVFLCPSAVILVFVFMFCFGAEDVKQGLVYGYLVGQCSITMICPSSLLFVLVC